MGTSLVRAGLIVYAIARSTIAAAAAGHDSRWIGGTGPAQPWPRQKIPGVG
jgi:hypothetical protein